MTQPLPGHVLFLRPLPEPAVWGGYGVEVVGSERTFVAIAHSHRMALEQASHNNNASTFRHYASSAIKRLEEWAPTLDELEAMVCAMTPEEAKACRKRAGLPEVKS